MIIQSIEFDKFHQFSNMVSFKVVFQRGNNEPEPQFVCIWGDTGRVSPKEFEPYRELILEHKSARLHLVCTTFEEKYLKKKNTPLPTK